MTSFIGYINNTVIKLVNIVPSSISYCMSVQVQYDTLRGTIFTNSHAITLLLNSNKYSSSEVLLILSRYDFFIYHYYIALGRIF